MLGANISNLNINEVEILRNGGQHEQRERTVSLGDAIYSLWYETEYRPLVVTAVTPTSISVRVSYPDPSYSKFFSVGDESGIRADTSDYTFTGEEFAIRHLIEFLQGLVANRSESFRLLAEFGEEPIKPSWMPALLVWHAGDRTGRNPSRIAAMLLKHGIWPNQAVRLRQHWQDTKSANELWFAYPEKSFLEVAQELGLLAA